MRIVVNDIAASKGGAMTVLKDFYNAIREYDSENEWIFLLGDKYFEETDNIKIIALPAVKGSHLKKLWFDFVSGKKFIKALKPDVVFSMQNTITWGLKVPQVLYVHQPLPFQSVKKFSFFKKRERKLAVYQHLISKIIKMSARRAAEVIVQTDWMKESVCAKCGIDESKVTKVLPNVPNIVEHIKADVFDRTSFFYPTSEIVYKNNECVYSACQLLDSEGLDYSVTMTLPEKYTSGKVTCTGRIEYEKVLEKYNTSTLVFPSYIETFGYPMAEARMLGAIVLASDCPFSRELLNGYENAYFFDPFKPEQLAVLMKKVINGEIVRKSIVQTVEEPHDNWRDVIDVVRKRRVLFLTNIPSPYRVDFFNELGKLCDLTVLFEKADADGRDDSWKKFKFENFRGIVLKGKSTATDKAFSPLVTKYLKQEQFERIVVGNPTTPTGIYAIQYLKRHKVPFYIEGDGAFPKNKKNFRFILKKYLYKGAEGYFSTSNMHDKYYFSYGVNEERILRYPFTSLKEADISTAVPDTQEKSFLRSKLNMREDRIIVSVGRMIQGKGFDVLINAASNIDSKVGIYLIGGKTTRELAELVNELGLTNIHFVDFMLKPQLKEYYRAADLFVLPTRSDVWGLVINEAMAAGLPVITTDRCIAGLELVKDGRNGYIVPTDDVDSLAKHINLVLSNDAESMGVCSLSIIAEYTVENMAAAHIKLLKI